MLASEYRIRLLAFDRTGDGGTLDPLARYRAISALSEFAQVSVAPVPQAENRGRYVWDHARSFFRDRIFTYYRHSAPEYGHLVQDALDSEKYDVVHVDSLDLAGYLPLLPLERVVLNHHNVESELLRDRARREAFPPLKRYVFRQAELQEKTERDWCPRVRLNITVSEQDAEELASLAPGSRIETVPNGVDVTRIRPVQAHGAGVVCVGGLGWFPNQDALEYLCESILPHLTSVATGAVTWVGRASRDQQADYARRFGIRLTGYVDNVLPYVHEATCYVMPFRLGGGSRLKLLEAMAAGKAIVSTSVGAMGVSVENDKHLIIADTPKEFAMAMQDILRDQELRNRLGREARLLSETKYAWEAIGKQMTQIYGRVA